MFEKQVAHGYFIMSVAAGLFVESYEKNPVLLNYGIDELRFTKPVYVGDHIQVRFTCKEKVPQSKKEVSDINKGIVKWLVEILDSETEIVGIATILTMVAKLNQD
jgi:oxepin-CoA hydrolase/3-oxo-5,6-dehydrosuberyl-CoA semialdehyde dehydrogenase